MCGRFGGADEFAISNQWGVTKPTGYRQSFNIPPGSIAAVILKNSPYHAEMMKWGLIPSWVKDPKLKFSTFNARAETVATSPVFRDSFVKRRCLVPVCGWYEWKEIGEKQKQPYFFRLKSRPAFALAGLWSEWLDAEKHPLRTFTIITTEPNDTAKPIHNRMPVVLPREVEDIWTDASASIEETKKFMKPYDVDNNLEVYPIHGERMRTLEMDDKRIIEPKDEEKEEPFTHPVQL